MFSSILFLRTDRDGYYHYQLFDTQFEVETTSKCGSGGFEHWLIAPRVAATIFPYLNRNLPVAANIARLYLYVHNPRNARYYVDRRGLDVDRKWLDKEYPELSYSTKIFPCVLNHIKQLQYGRDLSIRI